MSEALTPVSELSLPPELAFLSIQQITARRTKEREAQGEAMQAALQTDNVYHETKNAQQALIDGVEKSAQDYVSTHFKRESNPELFDYLARLVQGTSYYNMDDVEWNLGAKDSAGQHNQLETSGRSQYEAALGTLLGITTPETPLTPSTTDVEPPSLEDLHAARLSLEASRQKLAELSVKRRRKARKGGKEGDRLSKEYAEAERLYEKARIEYGALEARQWRHDGVNQTALTKKVVDQILDEHQEFTKAEMNFITHDKTRMGKFTRIIARHPLAFMGTSIAASFGIGYGIGWGTRKLTKNAALSAIGLGGAIALPAAIAGGVAIKTTKAILQSAVGNRVDQVTKHGKRAEQDYEALETDANHAVQGARDHTELVATAHGQLTNRINGRVNKDIRGNRNRIIAAAALSGAAGGLGFLFADNIIHHDGWQFGGFGHHDNSTNGVGTGSGGNGTPYQAGPPNYNTFGHPVDTSGTLAAGDHAKGLVDGYNPNVTIEHGNGYQKELTQLAAQKHINLTDAQSWNQYVHLRNTLGDKTQFFTNDSAYKAYDGLRISHPMLHAHWNPAVIYAINEWDKTNGIKAS